MASVSYLIVICHGSESAGFGWDAYSIFSFYFMFESKLLTARG